jgi:hypothetical protein
VSFEDTPNPNAMKFTLSVKIGPKALNLTSASDDHPLARRVFKIPGVRSVFAVNNFVTVTKDDRRGLGRAHPPHRRGAARGLRRGLSVSSSRSAS